MSDLYSDLGLMTAEDAAKLREPFPASAIGKLPRKTKTGGTIYLDYVGHAATTDRLLQVDPTWTWTPLALGDDGLPVFDKNGGLWIALTIKGVTRLGYGDAQGKTGPNAVKEAIGDAIRNAAMRFGVALDLWAKEDLSGEDEAPAPKQAPQAVKPAATETLAQLLENGLPPIESGPLALVQFLSSLEEEMLASGYWPEGVLVASLEQRGTSLTELSNDSAALYEFASTALEKARKKVAS